MTCPQCGRDTSAGQFCEHCGTPLAPPRVVMSRGDTGLDKSQTTIDASSQSTVHRDDHSIHVQKSETHTTTVNAPTTIGPVTNIRYETPERAQEPDGHPWWLIPVVIALTATALVVVVWLFLSYGWLFLSYGRNNAASTAGAPDQATQAQPPAPAGGAGQAPPPASPPVAGAASGDTGGAVGRPEAPVSPVPRHEPPGPTPRRDPPSYVNRTQFSSGGVAVLVVGGSGKIDSDFAQRITSSVGGTDALFTEAFVRDGLFARAHRGDGSALAELGLAQAARSIALATRRVTTNPQSVAGQEMFKAEVSLSVRVFRPGENWQSEGFSVLEVGAGFSPAEAERRADEAAAKKLVAHLGAGR